MMTTQYEDILQELEEETMGAPSPPEDDVEISAELLAFLSQVKPIEPAVIAPDTGQLWSVMAQAENQLHALVYITATRAQQAHVMLAHEYAPLAHEREVLLWLDERYMVLCPWQQGWIDIDRLHHYILNVDAQQQALLSFMAQHPHHVGRLIDEFAPGDQLRLCERLIDETGAQMSYLTGAELVDGDPRMQARGLLAAATAHLRHDHTTQQAYRSPGAMSKAVSTGLFARLLSMSASNHLQPEADDAALNINEQRLRGQMEPLEELAVALTLGSINIDLNFIMTSDQTQCLVYAEDSDTPVHGLTLQWVHKQSGAQLTLDQDTTDEDGLAELMATPTTHGIHELLITYNGQRTSLIF